MIDLVYAGVVAAIVSWTVPARRCERWKARAEEFNKLAHAAHASTERWQALAQTWKGTAEKWKGIAETHEASAQAWRELAEMRTIVARATSGMPDTSGGTPGGGTTEDP